MAQQRGKPGRPGHPPGVKAAVLAALLAGQGITETAEQYELPVSTVGTWAKEVEAARSPAGEERRADLGRLILDCLEAQLRTKLEILRSVSDPTWLARQNAADVAVLFGVIDDKTFRTLQALPEPDGDGRGGVLAGGAGEPDAA